MAKYSGAKQKILPENNTAPSINPRVLILHSAVGSGSLYNYFLNSTNLESHFWVAKNGTVEQYMDTNRRADANLNANAFAISVESADNGHPDTDPWTDIQIQRFAEMIVWANKTHGIPIKKCDKWDGSGIGYHTMWGAPSHWTPVAKSCPGVRRIKQFDEVIDMAKELAKPPAPKPPVPAKESDMLNTDLLRITGAARDFLQDRGAVLVDGDRVPVKDGKDGHVTYEWLSIWSYISHVQRKEEIQKTNALLVEQNDLLRKQIELLQVITENTDTQIEQ